MRKNSKRRVQLYPHGGNKNFYFAFQYASANLHASRECKRPRMLDNQNIRYHRSQKKKKNSDRSIARSASRARVMGRGNNSSNLPTQFYWICSRQLLLAPFCRLPSQLGGVELVALHVSFARTLVAAPQVCACKSQCEVVTTGSPRWRLDTHIVAAGSPTLVRVRPL